MKRLAEKPGSLRFAPPLIISGGTTGEQRGQATFPAPFAAVREAKPSTPSHRPTPCNAPTTRCRTGKRRQGRVASVGVGLGHAHANAAGTHVYRRDHSPIRRRCTTFGFAGRYRAHAFTSRRTTTAPADIPRGASPLHRRGVVNSDRAPWRGKCTEVGRRGFAAMPQPTHAKPQAACSRFRVPLFPAPAFLVPFFPLTAGVA